MRFGAVSTITLLSAIGLFACLPSSAMKDPAPGSGGQSGGGSSGGIASSGGQKSGGATSGSGGIASTGGSHASGGTTASGGISGAGGTTTVSGGAGGSASSGGSGGLEGTGARGGSGGSAGSGGAAGSGGSAGSGGTHAIGGTVGSGGVTPSGGSASNGSCADDPPPNQTPTCADWAAWNTCSADWFKTYCNRSCGRCSGGGQGGAGGAPPAGGSTGQTGTGGAAGSGGVSSRGGTSGGGGVAGPGTTNTQISGDSGFATRYWDCCKPSCAWTTNVPACQKDGSARISDKNAQSACSGGSAFECYDFTPWYDSSTNTSYGFAAHNGSCGQCFMLQFTGDGHSGTNAGATALKGQQMVVQAINIGSIASNQFDLLIPGGGVGANNACNNQWGSSADLGAQYGGLLTECNGDATCMKGKCQSVFGNLPGLLAGCNWFTGWYSSADNPNVVYKQVSCPSQITSKSGISG